jgi:hypothetical protein
MTTLPLRAPEAAALVAYLTSVTAIPLGQGIAPAGAGWQGPPGESPFHGYGILHSIPGGFLDGDLARPSVDGDTIWQLNAVGATQEQADTISDAYAAALLGPLPPITIVGRALLWVRADIPHGAARQDVDQPSLWLSYARYRLGTTPTS